MKYTLIQALRGLLSVAVVFMHLRMALTGMFGIHSIEGDPTIFAFLPDMIGGVPCGFFAISGYFMAFLVDRDSPDFLANRLVRVYPTYFICVALAFALRAFTAKPLSPRDLPAVLSLLPVGAGNDYKLGIEWTLVYEVTFYFACAFFCRPKWRKRFPAFLIGWLFLIAAANMAAAFAPAYGQPGGHIWTAIFRVIPYYPPPPLPNPLSIWFSIWSYCFVVGALMFYFLQRRSDPATMFWTGQVLLVSALAICVSAASGLQLLYILGLLSAFLIMALISLEKRFRSPKFLAQLGDYSYALYLIHPTIIILVLDRWHAITGQKPRLVASLFTLVVCFAAFWFLGQMDILVHKYCKKRLSRAMPKITPVVARAMRVFSPKGTS